MKLNRTKDIIIILLVFVAIYQTGQLWFEDISSRNFFYTFFTRRIDLDNGKLQHPFYTPYRVVTKGSKYFTIQYNALLNGEQNKPMEMLDAVLKNIGEAKFVSQDPLQWDVVLKDRCFVYQFYPNEQMNTTAFFEDTGKRNSGIQSKVKAFNELIVVPSVEFDGEVQLYFTDHSTQQVVNFHIKKQKLNDLLNVSLQQMQETEPGMIYESSKLLQLPLFEENIYLPKWQGAEHTFQVLRVTNPYLNENGEELINDIDSKVDIFFDNPLAKKMKPSENEDYFVYSEPSQKVVKYYLGEKSVLEYINYKIAQAGKKYSLVENYNTAMQFVGKIEKERESEKEYYLHHYDDEPEENKTTFYFDCVVNEMPMFLSDRLKKANGMEHHLEVTVDQGMVSRYKTIVLDYKVSNNTKVASKTYLDVVNSFLSGLGDNSSYEDVIKNIQLGYYLQVHKTGKLYQDVFVYWAIDLGDSIFYEDPE